MAQAGTTAGALTLIEAAPLAAIVDDGWPIDPARVRTFQAEHTRGTPFPPLVVWRTDDGRYLVIKGAHRAAALRGQGETTAPMLVWALTHEQAAHARGHASQAHAPSLRRQRVVWLLTAHQDTAQTTPLLERRLDEAGHALIAHLHGWHIGLVTIKPQLVDPSSRDLKLDGACHVRPNEGYEAVWMIACLLAGKIVDDLALQRHGWDRTRWRTGDGRDIERMWEEAAKAVGVVLHPGKELEGDALHRAAELNHRGYSLAEDTLTRHWPAVEALARELAREGTIDGDRAHDILRRAMLDSTPDPASSGGECVTARSWRRSPRRMGPLPATVLAKRHFAAIDDLECTRAERCVTPRARPDLVRPTTVFPWWPRRIKKRQGPWSNWQSAEGGSDHATLGGLRDSQHRDGRKLFREQRRNPSRLEAAPGAAPARPAFQPRTSR